MKIKRARVVRGKIRGGKDEIVSVYNSVDEILFALEKSLECCDSISDEVREISLREFMADQKTMKAVAMDFQMIGNFMGKMPEELLNKTSMLGDAYGFRCVIAHDYGNARFDYVSLWDAAIRDIPVMREELLSLLELVESGPIEFE